MNKQQRIQTQSGEILVDVALQVVVIYKPSNKTIGRVVTVYGVNDSNPVPASFLKEPFPEVIDPNVTVEAGDAFFQAAIQFFTDLGYSQNELDKIEAQREDYALNWNPPQ